MALASKVLVTGRRFHFDRVRQLASLMYPEAKIELWSDENLGGHDVRWWGKQFYAAVACLEKGESNPLSKEELDDIVPRCRFIREMPRDKAEILAGAGFLAWREILADNAYDCVCTLLIDAFVYDTLARAAKSLGIPALSPVSTNVPGHIRFTVRGEMLGTLDDSDVDAADFESFLAKLSEPSYRPEWVFGTSSGADKTARTRLLVDSMKRLPYFLYRVVKRDPLSFSFSPWGYQMKLMMASSARYSATLDMERFAAKPLPEGYALIPLQFYPEASTDYWIPELPMTDHHETVLKLVEALRGTLPVVIKEHPVAVGRRSARFLRKLMSYDHVYFAPLLYPMGSLVSDAELIIGSASTTMLQGICLGKKQVFTGTPYYGAADKPVLRSLDRDHMMEVLGRALDAPEPDMELARTTVWNLYKGTAPSSIGQYNPMFEKTVGNLGAPTITPLGRKLLESAHAVLRKSGFYGAS